MAEDMSEERPQSGFSVDDLLARLRTGDAGQAWKVFIDRYAPTILHIARQYEFDPTQLNDCFIYICEKLCKQNFRRLLASSPNCCRM